MPEKCIRCEGHGYYEKSEVNCPNCGPFNEEGWSYDEEFHCKDCGKSYPDAELYKGVTTTKYACNCEAGKQWAQPTLMETGWFGEPHKNSKTGAR